MKTNCEFCMNYYYDDEYECYCCAIKHWTRTKCTDLRWAISDDLPLFQNGRRLYDCKEAKLMDRTILHCDCNAFYASVECVLNPELKKVPMAVGGDEESRHGIILAKNEFAKKVQHTNCRNNLAGKEKVSRFSHSQTAP